MFGDTFKNAFHPITSWSGNRNPWDAAELIRKTIDMLSTFPEIGASNSLKGLSANNELSSYHDHLRHAIAMQTVVRRETEYKQPGWLAVTRALQGGPPANMADLHALILDHLETLKLEIKHSNTDIYKGFWRCDSYAHVDEPAVEDICRDRLIDLMKHRIFPLDLRIEPEGHMASDKRADIVILPPPGQKLPLELKCDTNKDLWAACLNQLDRLYARDPEASGYGIYVVFWFGNKRRGQIPKPPAGISMPQSPEKMETELRSLIPHEKHINLEVIVIDVSPPS